MKKLVFVVCFLLACVGMNFAQTAPAKKEGAKKEQTAKKEAAPTKKDGSPDMRYKANKNAAADTTKHLKKDGTADKRYKENKKKP
ncbi:hypothetical protein A4H97_23370 [Niastella yeongjuensis]|uniref:Uncharacterized protein n=1 Tax=Niastella yeongjuensis TaxID=354355 RepID=A0A1V9F553_9BACT|nr:hypothetical protein [Niastella yeongjuensis]OQP53392.1 hypothetical protein A4H97_23370 [Niastella yeongjuensis]SEP13420.1 hypothetical protein SAMN05660816_04527 [Niastella yeongjuensis]